MHVLGFEKLRQPVEVDEIFTKSRRIGVKPVMCVYVLDISQVGTSDPYYVLASFPGPLSPLNSGSKVIRKNCARREGLGTRLIMCFFGS